MEAASVAARSHRNQTIVIDTGSGLCKAGFAEVANVNPSVVFPTMQMIGESPMRRGEVTSWDQMERLWKHIFSMLEADPKEHAILLTDRPCSSVENQKQIFRIMFEQFHAQKLCLANSCVLSMNLYERKTGVVIESGDSLTSVVPIIAGRPIDKATVIAKYGGHDLTAILREQARISDADFAELNQIKESQCAVAVNYDAELEKMNGKTCVKPCTLRNGRNIYLGSAYFTCPEALFNPKSLANVGVTEENGLPQLVQLAVSKCEEEHQNTLYDNILLAGGNTMFDGLVPRLNSELKKVIPNRDFSVVASPERVYAAWRGGLAAARSGIFHKVMCVTREQYEEVGVERAIALQQQFTF